MARVPNLFSQGGLMGVGDPFLTLHREMNRLFDDVMRGGGPGGGGGQSGGQGTLLAPHMDVSETDKEVRMQVEMPGVNESDVELSLNDDVLTIRAEKRQERKEDREGVHISERTFGTFQRAIRLPFQVNPDQVQAQFENGVLKVTLPKTAPQERSRRIQVQSAKGGGQQTIEGGQPTQNQNQNQSPSGTP
ncbi:MAG: Hsp20/alpha crystallin family protein [Acetobacteraceae bacterium]|nr:Hsp20/alpha crystallin family protein [Acetobacteraceae bacterium]